MKKKNLFLTILLVCVLALGALPFALSLNDASALEGVPTSAVTIAEKYLLGDSITVPSLTLSCDGEALNATAVIVTPSGEKYQKESVDLNQTGKWTIEYRALKEGRIYRFDKSFSVVSNAFEINDGLGSATYGSHAYREDLEGLVVSLKPGGTLKINKAININGLKKTDEVLNFFLTPEKLGTPDVTAITVKFIDAYDKDNAVTLKFKNVYDESAEWTHQWSYFSAGATGQPSVGIEPKQMEGKLQIIYNGSIYILHQNNIYGAPVNIAFGGALPNQEVGDKAVSLAWDLEEKMLYGNNAMIMDFDEPIFYRENLWDGFTNGEVFVEMSAENYSASTCNFVINSIRGVDLTASEHKDESKPEIKIDIPEGEVFARVNEPFKIYGVSATDTYDASVKIDTKVYYNYIGNKNIIDIENGTFTPKAEGIYTIVYTATDKSGNITKKTVEVTAKAGSKLTASVEGGERNFAPEVSVPVPSVSNISGKATVKVIAKKGDEVIEIKDYKFSPQTVGDYTLEYEIFDYVSVFRATAMLKVKTGGVFAFEQTPSIPDYFIKGKYYDLSVADALDYSSETIKKASVNISVSENGGAYNSVEGRYTANASGIVKVKYSIVGSSVSYEKEVKVVDVKEGSAIKMERYFQGENATAVAGDDNVTITANGDGAVDFINTLQAYNFAMAFKTPHFSAQSLDIYLKSGEDTIKVTYIKKAGGADLYINDEKASLPIKNIFSGVTDFGYNSKTKTITPCNDVEITVKKTLEGKDFNGFKNNKVNLSFRFNGVTGATTLAVNTINGQPFSALARDLIAPQVLGEVIKGDILPGTELTIKPAIIADVLDPNLTVTMEVVGPDGNPVKSTDGKLLDDCSVEETYTICPTQYGSYMIMYTATDTGGRKASPAYGFIVIDNVAPVISLENKVTTAKVGEFVALAKATASDANDGSVKVYATVKAPDGRVHFVSDGAIKVTEKGVYTVSFVAYDEAGNTSFESYDIVVE